MWKIISPFIKSAREGAEPLIYLASNPKFDEISGKYYDQYNQKKSSTKTYDTNLQKAVWKESMVVTGLLK
ncbi:MAG: hypothetical protein GF317_06870 [Candidatus Lokiarchaeota archaeon]|nr:hypothetical protein [Candidatus Lokiarchaeota archaeon]MBD3199432.1 hypothetical protein [Candidatus Lokiarchaeota archaeon]